MKKEEELVLKKNGINSDRIKALKKSLKGYSNIKKELDDMQKIILQKEKEIEILKKKINKQNRKNMLDGLK